MSTQHRDEHSEWLREWQAEGQLNDSSQGELFDCATCGEEAKDIQVILESLEEQATRVRERDSGSRTSSPDLEGEVETNLRLFMAATPPKERRSLASWTLRLAPWLGLAATLLVLFVVSNKREDPQPITDPGREETWLDSEELLLLEPRGDVAEYSIFRWRTNLEGVEYYVLRIWDADDVESDPLTVDIEDGETQWTPEDEQRRSLPNRLRWKVSAHDQRELFLGESDPEDAWLRSD